MEKVRYMISDAANRIQVESHVLRYWEEELELNVPRNEMGHRYYTEENLRQFEEIKRLKEEGYQLKAIKMLIHNPHTGETEAGAAEGAKAAEENPEAAENSGLCAAQVEGHGNLPARQEETGESAPAAAEAPRSKLEQFQMMMNEIVCRAIAENNQALSREIGAQVEERVLKEMNYLMREREEQEEERFRKLDEAIRSRQRRGRKEKAARRREKSGRIRLRTRESVS